MAWAKHFTTNAVSLIEENRKKGMKEGRENKREVECMQEQEELVERKNLSRS